MKWLFSWLDRKQPHAVTESDLAFSDDVDPASRDPLPLDKLLEKAQNRLRPVV